MNTIRDTYLIRKLIMSEVASRALFYCERDVEFQTIQLEDVTVSKIVALKILLCDSTSQDLSLFENYDLKNREKKKDTKLFVYDSNRGEATVRSLTRGLRGNRVLKTFEIPRKKLILGRWSRRKDTPWRNCKREKLFETLVYK